MAPTEEMHARLRSVFGSDGTRRHEGSLTGTLAGMGYMLGLAQTRSAGFRAHSRGEQTTLLLKGERELDDGSMLRVMLSSGEPWTPQAWAWLFERVGGKRVPLPGLPWSPDFMHAYEAARGAPGTAGQAIGASKTIPGSARPPSP